MHFRTTLIAAFLVAASQAFGSWNGDPRVRNPISTADSAQIGVAICSDGRGGALMAWEDQHVDTLHTYIFIQRVDDRGATLWRTNGIPITTCLEDFQHTPKICSDGFGGAIVAWPQDTGTRHIYAQRIDSTGQRLWGCGGVRVSSTPKINEFAALVSDGAGGAYAVWSYNDATVSPALFRLYANRIDRNGAPVWSGQILITSVPVLLRNPTAIADSLSNLFVGWVEFVPPEGQFTFRVQKMLPAGTPAWAVAAVAPPDTFVTAGAIVGDQHGGAFVMTTQYYPLATTPRTSITRLTAKGSTMWTYRFGPKHASQPCCILDHKGGVIGVCKSQSEVPLYDTDVLYAQRLDSAGAALWGSTGVTVSDPNTISMSSFAAVGNGAAGFIAAWTQTTSNATPKVPWPHLFANQVDSNGKLFWGASGKILCNADSAQLGVVGVSGFQDEMIGAWVDYRDTGTRADVYSAKLGDPWLVTADTVIDFGKVNIGDTSVLANASFLANRGVEDVTVASQQLAGPGATDFAIVNDTTDVILKYRESRDLVVRFNPRLAGAKAADIHYASTTRFPSPVVHLRGRGVVPNMQVTPLVDLGNVPVGSSRDSVVVNLIRSTGSGFFHVDSIRIAGTNGVFTIDSGNIAPAIVDSGMKLTLKIGFHPTVRGRVTDTIYVFGNTAATGSIRLAGTGTRGSIALSARQLDFGNVPVGAPTDSTLAGFARNTGTAPDTALTMEFHGGDSSEFRVAAGGAPFALGPGASKTVTLECLPLSPGDKLSTLVIAAASGDTLSFAVHALAVAPAARSAVLTLAAASVDLGDTLVGRTVDSLLFAWVKNTGDTSLVVSSMTIDGPNAGEFFVDDSTTGFTVDPTQSHAITVHFRPLSSGSKTAQIQFICNSTNAPSLTLLGRAHAAPGRGSLAVAATVVDCGSGSVGLAISTLKSGFVQNTGSGPLTVTSMAIAGANAAEFVVTSPQSFLLAAGATHDLAIQFTPAAVGARTATLTITTDIGDIAVVALTGSGTSARLIVSAATVDFGRVAVGATGDTTLLAFVTNVGTDSARITTAAVSGVDATSFAAVSFAQLALAPQESGTVRIRFQPLRTGAHAASLLVITASDTVRAALVGRGVRLIRVSCGSAHGKPGEVVRVPIETDSSAAGTSVRALDVQIVFTTSQFYPNDVVAGAATLGWSPSPVAIASDTVTVHLSSSQPLSSGTRLFELEGMMLQGTTVRAPIRIVSVAQSGDADVTTLATGQGELTLDTVCGYGTQTFLGKPASLIVWTPSPNPANTEARIAYRLGTGARIAVELRDEQGRVVYRDNVDRQTGEGEIVIDTRALPAGVFVCTLSAAGAVETERIVVAH